MTHNESRETYRTRIMETARLEGDEALLLANDLTTADLNACVHLTAQ
jgi:hypothetical protein